MNYEYSKYVKNFCLENLSEISCDKPSAEGHEVTNLISLIPSSRRKGFLADYFVKPPVSVYIKFICPINIKHILIKSQVGAQKSKIFSIKLDKEGTSQSVASSLLQSSEKNVFIQCHGAKSKCSLGETKYDTFRSSKLLKNVSNITINIVRTEASSVPAMGGLEIWGELPRSTPKATRDIISKTLSSHNSRCLPPPVIPASSTSSRHTVQLPSVSEQFHIPEEFLDPITCEIMSLPMLLPCGKIVDLSTLEKFYDVEAQNGRGQSNPFTFELFTDQKKPIIATSLKHRLDKFLLDYSNVEQLKFIPRTVGRKSLVVGVARCTTLLSSPPQPPRSAPQDTSTSSGGSSRTIDQLLENSLLGLPSFLERPVKKSKHECSSCSNTEVLYQMSCHHLICRNCILEYKKNNNSLCPSCQRDINFKTVFRIHL